MERGVVHKMHGREALLQSFPPQLQLFLSNSIYWLGLLFLTPAGRIVCPDYLGGILLGWVTCPGDSVIPVMPFNLIYPSNNSRRCTDSCPHFCVSLSQSESTVLYFSLEINRSTTLLCVA